METSGCVRLPIVSHEHGARAGAKACARVPSVERVSSSDRGQALVELAVVLPIIFFFIFGLVEFAFVLNVSTSVNYATRDAAMLAAEGGRLPGTDCVALQAVERDLTSPASPPRVQRVEIYWSDANGSQIGSAANVYDRTGSTACDFGDGSTVTVPYTLTTAGYPEDTRCDVLAGCGGSHTTLDTVGVRVTYQHQWVTSFGQNIAGTVTFQKSTAVRMEPTL